MDRRKFLKLIGITVCVPSLVKAGEPSVSYREDLCGYEVAERIKEMTATEVLQLRKNAFLHTAYREEFIKGFESRASTTRKWKEWKDR